MQVWPSIVLSILVSGCLTSGLNCSSRYIAMVHHQLHGCILPYDCFPVLPLFHVYPPSLCPLAPPPRHHSHVPLGLLHHYSSHDVPCLVSTSSSSMYLSLAMFSPTTSVSISINWLTAHLHLLLLGLVGVSVHPPVHTQGLPQPQPEPLGHHLGPVHSPVDSQSPSCRQFRY